MTFDEMLNTLNSFDVSELNFEELKLFREALQIKAASAGFFMRCAKYREASKKSGD